MIIKKLVVRGDSYQRTLNFSSGLNIISGEKTSGKSLVLSLIDYCLGKQKNISLKVQTELDSNIEFVFLEIMINEDTFTICRSIKKGVSNFWVYYSEYKNVDDYIPEKLSKKNFQSFLMKQLGAIEFIKTKNKSRTNRLTTETISFRDIYRYCFVSQHDLGTHNFLAYNETTKRYKNPICFEMIFDLINYSQNDLQSGIVEIQNRIEDNKKNKENLEGYLRQRGNTNITDLLHKINELNSQIEKLQRRKDEIVKSENLNQEVIRSNKYYILLNSEIRELEDRMQEYKKNIHDIELGIASNELLLNDYRLEMDDIQATKEINYRMKIEDQELICPLCNSKVKNNFQEEKNAKISRKNYESILKGIKNKIKMVDDIIEKSLKNIMNLKGKLDRMEKKKKILLLTLEEFSKDVQTPLLPELNSINVNISGYEKSREILLESKRVFNKIDELTKNINNEEKELNTLKSRLKCLDDNNHRKENIINELNSSYINTMKRMKYPEEEGAFIDSKNYFPHYKNASVYEQESGGLLECMQLSYLNSIISSKESKFHPKILLLDSISKYFGTNENDEFDDGKKINDPEVYLNIFFMLRELSRKAQIIVVENTPPREISEFVKYTFRSGEYGFIDQTQNEIFEG